MIVRDDSLYDGYMKTLCTYQCTLILFRHLSLLSLVCGFFVFLLTNIDYDNNSNNSNSNDYLVVLLM